MTSYVNILEAIDAVGYESEGRNGITKQLTGVSLYLYTTKDTLQLISGRPFYIKGVLGEYAALIRRPKHIDDFKKFGCNYWDQFGDKNGNLKLDYGNGWIYNGSFDRVYRKLQAKQFTRDLVISNWVSNPDNLTLPCCHFAYQFIKSANNKLDLIWYQRSADMLVGVPSDMLLAQLMLILFAKLADLEPNKVIMHLGSAHIYQVHYQNKFFDKYLVEEREAEHVFNYKLSSFADPANFKPEDITIDYKLNNNRIKFECVR